MKNETDVTRKKQKEHTRNHWMCRVQLYTFGIDAPTTYVGFCPFFWMTWLALVCLPPVFVWKQFVRIAEAPGIAIMNFFEKSWDSTVGEVKNDLAVRRSIRIQEPTDSQLIILSKWTIDRKTVDNEWVWRRLYDVDLQSDCVGIANWLRKVDDLEPYVEAAKARGREKRREEESDEKEIKEARKIRAKRWNAFVKNVSICGSLIFKILIPAAIVAGALGIYWLAALAISAMTLSGILMSFVILFSCLAVGTLAEIGIDFYRTFLSRGASKSVAAFVKFINTIIEGIHACIEFLGTTARTVYKAECPMIIWGDTKGPITKRKLD